MNMSFDLNKFASQLSLHPFGKTDYIKEHLKKRFFLNENRINILSVPFICMSIFPASSSVCNYLIVTEIKI